MARLIILLVPLLRGGALASVVAGVCSPLVEHTPPPSQEGNRTGQRFMLLPQKVLFHYLKITIVF